VIIQFDAHAIVQERQFADTFCQNFVMEFNVREDFFISPEMHFGTAFVGVANDFDREVRTPSTVSSSRFCATPRQIPSVDFAIAAYRQFQ
jgi:hypothetical protein